MSKGFFLALGGIGGSGKSGLVKKISEYFTEKGVDHICTFEPGGTPAANYLRQLCRQGLPDCEPLTPMAEAMLFNAARAQHVETVIRPALAEGKVVICDRYAETTYAYQGSARGASIFNLQQIHHYGIGLDPDLTIILDGDVEVFMGRVHPEERASDKFDAMDVAAQTRVQECFDSLIKNDTSGKYVSVEADGTREELWEQVLPYLEKIKTHQILNTVPNPHFERGIQDTSVPSVLSGIIPGKVENKGIFDRDAPYGVVPNEVRSGGIVDRDVLIGALESNPSMIVLFRKQE